MKIDRINAYNSLVLNKNLNICINFRFWVYNELKFTYLCRPKIFDVMKKGIHPESYRMVVFKDISTEDLFLVRSCANTKETIEVDGKEYPLFKLEISSKSHPFYTGKMKFVDSAGRIDKFKKKFAKFTAK